LASPKDPRPNRDLNFTRPRIRTLMPVLAAEGGDTRNLVRLASRLARANAAVEVLVDGAERYLALRDLALLSGFNAKTLDAGRLDAKTFDARFLPPCPTEIRLCGYCQRVIDRGRHEGPAELGKVEACCRHWTWPVLRTMQGDGQG